MKKRKVLARIYTFTLAASLIAADALPVFAGELSGELASEGMQVLEENFGDEGMGYTEDARTETITEIVGGTEPEPGTGTEISDGLIYVNDTLYNGYYMDSTGIFYIVSEGVTAPFYGIVNEGTEYCNCDNSGVMTFIMLPKQTMFVAGKVYTGYYMDRAGMFYTVAAGTTEPANGVVDEGTEYYSYEDAGGMEPKKLPKQTMFVGGKAYTGYYMDRAGIFYAVTAGTAEPANGVVSEGTEYYSCDDAGIMASAKLSKQTLYVNGELYSGYYLSNANEMYRVEKGTLTLKTGIMKKGAKYYCYHTGKTVTLSKQMLYVNGKVYTGYYMNNKNKMYHVKKGTLTLKTGIVKKGAKYYCYHTGKSKTLSRQTLYVNGKVYTGYYMGNKNKMYHVKKGTLTLKTGIVKKGAKYYSFHAKKTKTLSKQTLYVNGKVYTGYYMGSKNKMYHVKKGTYTLKTGIVKNGTKYYSYKSKKTKKLSKETLYVNGKVYTGYYLDNKNTMYSVNKGTLALTTGMMGKDAQYYSYKSKKTETLAQETLYVDGIVYNGYYLGSDQKMYSLSNGIYTPVNTMLNAGTMYYSCNEQRMLALPAAKVYVYGAAVEGLTPGGMATLQKAQSIVQTLSAPTDSKADKLYKCYLWMEKFPYVQYRTMEEAITSDPVDWDVVFANDIFDLNAGCCASEACAFAYMAKACGYEKVTICSDTEHAWVDIDGRLYDPLFAEDRNFSKNYNAEYTDYRIHPAYTREL